MKEKVAFVCVHNSCRSQIAEVLGKSLVSEIFESYSAGTEFIYLPVSIHLKRNLNLPVSFWLPVSMSIR